jgi:hypothetical protein
MNIMTRQKLIKKNRNPFNMNMIKNIFTKLMLVAVSVLIADSAATAQDKVSPKLRISYFKYMDGRYEIKGRAYTKKGKETEPCSAATIGFYKDADYEQLFKKQQADEKGQTVLQLSDQDANAFKDSSGQYHFYARVEKDGKYKSHEADISVMNAALNVDFKQESDTVRRLKASLMCYDAATKKMVTGVKMPLKCFVKRALCLLPVGKDLNYTDEEGNVEVTFPNDIPGDKDGNLTIIVKLDEDENYGTVQYDKIMKWGVPMLAENPFAARSLIGSRNNAPWFMVVIITAILISIWGYLCYIIYGLFRVNKIGKLKT